MNILVVGDPRSQAEFKAKFKDNHPTTYKNYHELKAADLPKIDVIFDFSMEGYAHGACYTDYPQATLFVNSVKTTLTEIQQTQSFTQPLVGFNGIPGLFDRPILELVRPNTVDESYIRDICRALQTDYLLVKDRVGMVTPRVLCMIINEAYFTLQEGTASIEDIDLGMKLGTRYPMGPFEFCQAIGMKYVYELLDAIYHDTKDERYKICPELKREYLIKR